MTIEFPPSLNLITARAVLQGSGNPDALENVVPTELPDGAICWVINQQILYYLDKFSTTAVSAPSVIATILGAVVPGRWKVLVTGGGGPPTGPAGGDLAGTYPNPDVRGLHETGGPTGLLYGAIANGQVLQRSGATVIGVAATFPPNGAAGGQLGGTYPNPDVRGMRETTGPTLLTYGAVADGEFLKRVGATVVGASAGGGPIASGIVGGGPSSGNQGPDVLLAAGHTAGLYLVAVWIAQFSPAFGGVGTIRAQAGFSTPSIGAFLLNSFQGVSAALANTAVGEVMVISSDGLADITLAKIGITSPPVAPSILNWSLSAG